MSSGRRRAARNRLTGRDERAVSRYALAACDSGTTTAIDRTAEANAAAGRRIDRVASRSAHAATRPAAVVPNRTRRDSRTSYFPSDIPRAIPAGPARTAARAPAAQTTATQSAPAARSSVFSPSRGPNARAQRRPLRSASGTEHGTM